MSDSDAIAAIIARHEGREGPLLPILHDVQNAFGHVGEDAVRAIAAALNLTRAEVHGVVSFYADFLDAPRNRPVVRLCRAEACQARGVEALVAGLPEAARTVIEPVYCLGLCSAGPAAVDAQGRLHARLTAEKLAGLVSAP